MDFNFIKVETGSRGRPKGKSNKVRSQKKRAMSLAEKQQKPLTREEKEVLKIEQQGLTLGWVGKLRNYKDKWEEEEKFRNKFLNGELKVRESYELNSDRRMLRHNPEGDLKYKAF